MDIIGKQWKYITELFTKKKLFITQNPIFPEKSPNEKRRLRKQEKINLFRQRWACFHQHSEYIFRVNSCVNMTRYPWDEQLFCRELFQTDSKGMKRGVYIIDFLPIRNEDNVFGMEQGTYDDGEKNGEYRQIFYSLYGNELPELFLWETSPNFRTSIRIEETGTYLNDTREGPYTIVYFYTNCLPFKIVCEEKGTYQNNKKEGPFRRIYYNLGLWNDSDKCHLRESGIFYNNGRTTSTLEKLNHEGKIIYKQTLQKRIYQDHHTFVHRTTNSCTRQECKYTLTDKNTYEYGTYSYSICDIQSYLFLGGLLWRRGTFYYMNRIPNYDYLLRGIGEKHTLPMEIEDYIGSFLEKHKNTRFGCFLQDRKTKAQYTKKGYLSDDGKYIHVPNISDLVERKKQTLIFEKNLLWDSSIFDNESFCLLDSFYIGCTYTHSKFYEPVFKVSPYSDRQPTSVIRFLFNRKGFKGYIIFKNKNRNFISRDNIQFLSTQKYEQLTEPVTTLHFNPNFRSRP